jgi:hypothetical protein
MVKADDGEFSIEYCRIESQRMRLIGWMGVIGGPFIFYLSWRDGAALKMAMSVLLTLGSFYAFHRSREWNRRRRKLEDDPTRFADDPRDSD